MNKKDITFGDLQNFINKVNDKKTSYLDKIELYSNYLNGVEISKLKLEVISLIGDNNLLSDFLEVYQINQNLYIIDFFIINQSKNVYSYFIKGKKNFLSNPFSSYEEALISGICKQRNCLEYFSSICKLLNIKLEEKQCLS